MKPLTESGPVLLTGVAGFIGFHVAQRLLADGVPVVGVDNVNPYYDVRLKRARLQQLEGRPMFRLHELDIADAAALRRVVEEAAPSVVIHLAAQAGVRWSLDHPEAYVASNLVGFANVLECCRHAQPRHFLYASSSSVYGAQQRTPFRVGDPVGHPVSFYAATKVANEVMAASYSHLYGIPSTGLRFFTVYGPWGRPDMAYYKFTKAILAGEPIDVYASGELLRDFTYVDDVVEGVIRLINRPPPVQAVSGSSATHRHRIFNIGNSEPVRVNDFLATLESVLGRRALRRELPMQPGDVPATFADVTEIERETGYRPRTSLREGLERFWRWYRGYTPER